MKGVSNQDCRIEKLPKNAGFEAENFFIILTNFFKLTNISSLLDLSHQLSRVFRSP